MAPSLRRHALLAALGLGALVLAVPVQQAFGQAFTARRSHTQTVLADGNILVVGGISDENPGPVAYLGAAAGGVQRLNELRGVIENVSVAGHVARSSHSATLLPDGRVLVVGGYNAGGPIATYNLYNPILNSWAGEVALPVVHDGDASNARYNHTASLLKDGRVLICGGESSVLGSGVVSVKRSCDVFTPGYGAADSMAAGLPLITGRTNHTASIVFGGDVFVAGGWNPAANPQFVAVSERYRLDCNPPTGCWSPAVPMIEARSNHTATTMADGKVLISGGNNSKYIEANRGFLSTSEIYDSAANRMVVAPNLTARKTNFSALLRPDGMVTIQGGLGNIPTTYITPALDINAGSTINGPGAAGCTNPAGALPYCDLDTNQSVAAITGGNINLSLEFQLGTEVTGILREAELLIGQPQISYGNGTATLVPGSGNEYAGYSGAYGILAGAPVGCGASGCGLVTSNNLALQGIATAGGTLGFDKTNPAVPGTTNDLNACIDFVAATISLASPASAIQYGNPAPFPAGGSNRCPGGRNSWNQTILVTGLPVNTIGGVISSGTLLLEAIDGESSRATDINFNLEISSMFAEIPAGTAIFGVTVNGDLLGAISFSAEWRDITGVVGVDTDTAVSGPIQNNIILGVNGATMKYVASQVTLDDAGFTAGISTVIVRSMVFADYDEFDPSTPRWSRIPLNTTYLSSKYSHSATLTPGGDQRFWGGRTCDYIATTNCSAIEVNPNPYAGLRTFQQNWTAAAGGMSQVRGNHTATVLPGTSGYILIAGGTNGPSVLSSAELYDPVDRTFADTGSMRYARDLHTASLLPNGKVLVAGGFAGVSTGPTSSAELYYPREGIWRDTGIMFSSRDSHVAVTLPDGNIMVFGGYAQGEYLATAEIYYSTIGAWRAIPAATDANPGSFRTIATDAGGACGGESPRRAKHTATLLKNGEILFAGGAGPSGVLSSALLLNLFNPLRAVGWYCANSLGMPGGPLRYVHSHSALSLPNGNVLVSFGNDGMGHAETPPLALIYDPYADTWTSGVQASQTGVTFNHAAVMLPNGKAMIVGGARGMNQSQRGTMLYDLLGSTYAAIGTMGTARAWHTATITLGQEVVAIGGYANGSYVNSAEYYPIAIMNRPDAFMAGGGDSVRLSSITSVDAAGAIYSTSTFMTVRDKNLIRITDAASGGHSNSSHFHPRMVLQAVDTSGGTSSQGNSGFYIDLTTRIYHSIAGTCANGYCNRWSNSPNIFGTEALNSSFTIRMPEASTGLPNGWYNLRLGQNGLYSDSMLVRIGPPLPLAPAVATGTVLSTTSIYWTWPYPGGSIVGYNIYYATSSVFITTVTTPISPDSASFLQQGLTPNVTAAIIVEGFSQTGDGPTTASDYAFTLATVPASIRFSTIQANSVNMEWSPNGNSNATIYEITIALDPAFTSGVRTPTDDLPPLTTTYFELLGLRELTTYYLRMRAQNLDDQWTDFAYSSFTTRWNYATLAGAPCTENTADVCILWQWTSTGTAVSYNIYNATVPSTSPGYKLNAAPLIPSGQNVSFTDTPLKCNNPRALFVTGVRASGDEWPLTMPTTVYTWASEPRQSFPDPYMVIEDSQSIMVRWDTNRNPATTYYSIFYSTLSDLGFFWVSTGTFQTSAGLMRLKIQNLLPSEVYYASMTAVNMVGTPTSGTALGTIATMANEPADLRIVTAEPNSVTIEWGANGNTSSTTYEVSYSTDDPTVKQPPALIITVARDFAEFNSLLSATITGLDTGRRYYFRVRSQNIEGLVNTAYSSAVSTITPSGSVSATSGQLGGVIKVGQDSGFTGTVGSPAVRTVTISAPAGTFTTDVEVVISTFDASGVASVCSGGVDIGLYINPIPYLMPLKPLTLTFTYTAAELGGGDPDKMVLMRYDPGKGKCVPLPTVVDPANLTVTALINHFSAFQLAAVTPPTDPHAAKAFPNPFYKSRDGFMSITDMPPYSRIRIFTLQGDLVYDRLADGAGMLEWRGLNMWGRTVASGMYLAVIQHGDDKKILKLVMLR
ncbi:MAG: fibronectin type III domain-containing protein [Elusimicrobia bacterium]|nr:fibronectin type III domain-containing protein [Elusimicrobiota bacterium]